MSMRPTTVNNNSIPSNTLPSYDCNEANTTSECNNSDCYIAHDNFKRKIFKKKGGHILHLNIKSLLAKIDEVCFILKQT